MVIGKPLHPELNPLQHFGPPGAFRRRRGELAEEELEESGPSTPPNNVVFGLGLVGCIGLIGL